MSAAKRARACDNCHSIKIKCELGSIGGPGPCNRCVRLGKDCTITPPKRQKDRVAELEAQVETLTRLLEAQKIQVPPPIESGQLLDPKDSKYSTPASSVQASAPPKKRKLEYGDSGEDGVVPKTNFLARLDAIIPRKVQSELLDRYHNDIFPVIPLVPIEGLRDYLSMREKRPILLQAALYAACSSILTFDAQEEIAKLNWDVLSWNAIEQKQKSLEILQAIQITYLWFRAPKHHTHVAIFDLVQLGSSMAEELCLGGPISSADISGWARQDEIMDNEQAWRTWLVCRLLSSSICLLLRRPETLKWNEYDDVSLQMLEYWQETALGTRLVCHIVKAERLSERIAAESGFYDWETAVDVADPTTQSTRISLQGAVLDFQAAIASRIDSEIVTFWTLLTTMYLHEPVLHTPTNKRSFAAPFLAERLSITDFPIPSPVVEEHITSIHTLKATTHALLDVFLTFDATTSLALPAVLVHGRVAYAQFILVKMYVATTAAGNTLGAFFDPEGLNVDHYLQRVIKAHASLMKLDERCGATRVLYSATRLREWYLNYKSTFVDQAFPNGQGTTATSLPGSDMQFDWTIMGDDSDVVGFGLEGLFNDPLSVEGVELIPWNEQQTLQTV